MSDRWRLSRLVPLPFWSLSRRDVLAIIFGAAILASVLFAAVKFSDEQRTRASFGPDWECTSVSGQDSVCIKKPPKPPGTAAPSDQPPAR